MSGDWEAAGPSRAGRRGRGMLVVGAALLLAAGSAVGVALRSVPTPSSIEDEQPRDDLRIVPDSPEGPALPELPPDPAAPASPRRGGRAGVWRPLGTDQRISPRADPVMVWTGEHVLVWGGRGRDGWRGDGGRYDPQADRWQPLPSAPALATSETSGTWVGERLVVLGADDQEGLAHGLVSPSGQWEPAAPAPDEGWDWSSAVRLDDRVVVAGEASTGGPVSRGGTAFAAYDPASDDWEVLGRAPLSALRTFEAAGSMLVAVGVPARDAEHLAVTALDPDTGVWSDPDPAPMPGDWTPRAAADPDRGRVLLLGAAQERGLTHVAAAWSPDDGWMLLPAPPRSLSRAGPEAFASSAGTVVWTPGDSEAAHLLIDGGHGASTGPSGTWRAMASPGEDLGQGARSVWTGRELVVWGGSGPEGPTGEGAVWRRAPASAGALPPGDAPRVEGDWTRLPLEDRRVRRGPALAAAGETVAVWGGRGADGPRADGVLLDAAAQVAGPIPDAPVGGRTGAAIAIDGRELIVWGGSDGGTDRADGAAFDLSAGTWRRLPEAPLPAAPPAAAVDGETVIVAAGDAAARLHPAEDRWDRLEAPPVGPATALLATARGVLLIGGDGGAAILGDTGWTRIADHGLEGELAGAQAAGRVLVWDGERGAIYQHDQDRWRSTAPVWTSGGSTALTPLADDVVVWGAARVGDAMGGRLGAAALDPASARWRVLPDPPSGVSLDALVTVGDRILGWSSEGTVVGFVPAGEAAGRSGRGAARTSRPRAQR